ncbi:MAG TPA: FAD-binding protein, partial [Marmoricola sp.]|nr:FAD-binding protein [Marmoricola sp.]
QDTWLAGAASGDPETISRIVAAGPEVVADLISIGVGFDRRVDGLLELALEGGHSRHRVAHVGDSSGAAITAALAGQVRDLKGIEIKEASRAARLIPGEQGEVRGVEFTAGDQTQTIRTDRVILATGGLGGLFAQTTNPLTATGHGVALAARAGARVADLHLVQFHPTALDVGADPMPLLTEALRGAGAVLLADGQRFVAELEPRDVVSAAVWEQQQAGRHVVLDARGVPDVTKRFPRVASLTAQFGLSLTGDVLPIKPAVHYSMGGVSTDARCRTSVPGLWAVGEVARTGLHGANRLASNSLLEAMVTGRAAGQDAGATALADPDRWEAQVEPADPMTTRHLGAGGSQDQQVLAEVRRILGTTCGVLRDGDALFGAVNRLADLAGDDAGYVGWLIARSAFLQPHSIGAHRRQDHLFEGAH